MFDWEIVLASDDDAGGEQFGGEIDVPPLPASAGMQRRGVIEVRESKAGTPGPVEGAGEVQLDDLPTVRVDAFARLVRPLLTLVVGLTIVAILILAAISDFEEKKLSLREVYGVLGGAVLGMLGKDLVLPSKKRKAGK